MRKNLLAFILMLFAVVAWAQERTVTGRVISTEDNVPLPGVSVLLKGTSNGTATDADGRFSISVPSSGGSLVFSFIGLATQTIEIGERSIVDLAMESDITQLSEVVVVGYSTVQKKELTGAVSSVKGDVIRNLPMQSFDRAMQGRAAGVQVLSSNGVPGGQVSVRIRGVGSITAGNEPLYVVDGVQLNNRNDGGARVSSNPLSFLNPNDIESIEILKDAANASIYGAQAANGVVLITTKKGKSGAKTRFDFNYYKGVVEPMPTLDVMNTQEWIQVRREALQTVSPAATEQSIRETVLTSLNLPITLTDADIAALPTYDWQKEAFKTGTIDNYELSMSGGNATTTFYTSASYNKQEGSLIGIDFDRLTGRINLDHKITSKLSFETSLNLSTVRQHGPYGDARATTAFGAPQYASPTILTINPIYDPETGGFYGLQGSGTAMIGDLNSNVIANANYIKSLGRTNQIVGSAAINYTIAKGLNFRGFVGMDYRHLYAEFFGDPRLNDYYALRGTQTTVNNTNRNLTTNYTLNYSGTFGTRHSISGLAGFEYRDESNEGSNFNGTGFPTPDFTTPNAAATPVTIGGFWSGFKRVGYFGNLKYDLDKKYFLSLTMRYDGSSRFGDNNKFGFFPSVSAAWNINEENFLKNSAVVSDLRLRASWGTTGNDQIGNFDSRILYGLGGTRNTLNFMNGLYNGVSGIGIGGLGNPDLRWEKNETYNIGIDYGFLQSRISGSVEVFQRNSRDLLLDMAVPQTSGYNTIRKNIGEVRNEGLEFELRTTNVDVGDFKWETNFNITFIRNEVRSLFDDLDVLPGDLTVRVHHPLFTNVNNPYAGVNPANGRPMHYDLNGNLTYIRSASDIRPVGGKNMSDMYGGFTNTFTYKGVELSGFFQYDYGRTSVNIQRFRMADNGGVLRNGLGYFYDNRWTTPGQITDVPRPANNRTESSARISSYQTQARFYEDASFIRLKQVTLAYNIPQPWLTKYHINNVRVYAQAVNLLTWTKWTGYDPEFQETDANRGTEGIVPQTRNYTFGVQVGF